MQLLLNLSHMQLLLFISKALVGSSHWLSPAPTPTAPTHLLPPISPAECYLYSAAAVHLRHLMNLN